MPVLLDLSFPPGDVKGMRGTQEDELLRQVVGALGTCHAEPVQGMYCLTPEGRLIGGQVQRYGSGTREHLESALKEFRELRNRSGQTGPRKAAYEPKKRGRYDQTIPYQRRCPEGGIVVRVTNRFIDGGRPRSWSENLGGPELVKQYEEALGRDVLWIRKDEVEQLVQGRLPDSVKRRLVLFHLLNNTYGQYGGAAWQPKDIKKMEMELSKGRLSGSVHLESSRPKRSYRAEVLGFIEGEGAKLSRFDLVFKGLWGEVTDYEFKITNDNRLLAVAFALAGESDLMRNIPPGCLGGYSSMKAQEYLR